MWNSFAKCPVYCWCFWYSNYTGILHLYICKYVQITKSIHYHHFMSITDKNNRHLSGYDQITFIGDDVPTRK